MIIVLIIGAVVAAFVLYPALTNQVTDAFKRTDEALARRADLLARRLEVYQTIINLDFDYSVDKIAQEEYVEQRQALVAEAVGILQELDALAPVQTQQDQIDVAATQLRTGKRPRGNYCPSCGDKIAADDNFCAVCGLEVSYA